MTQQQSRVDILEERVDAQAVNSQEQREDIRSFRAEVNSRFDASDARMESRFNASDARMESRFNAIRRQNQYPVPGSLWEHRDDDPDGSGDYSDCASDPVTDYWRCFSGGSRMTQLRPSREVVVAGVGLHPFGRFPDKDLNTLALEAVLPALKDAGVRWRDIPIAYFGHVYYHGMSLGETTLSKLGLTGVPIVNVENACSSGSTAFWQAYWGIATGIYDMALAFGAEKVPRGPVTVTAEDSPERYIGGDHMMAGYALRARRYLEETGAPEAALAQVSVKARQNAAMNPYAHRKDTYTVEEVLQSRLIADPLTLYQCCPTSEGAAAAVLCARDSLARYGIDEGRAVGIAAAVLTSGQYNGRARTTRLLAPTAPSQPPSKPTR